MATNQFSVRLDDEVIKTFDDMAAECRVKRAQVIDWALEAYKELFLANGGRQLTSTDLEDILEFIKNRSLQRNTVFLFPRAAEETSPEKPEPGKIVNPASHVGGGKTAKATGTYPKPGRRKSSG